MLIVPCCFVVCVLVLYNMWSYLLLISFADTVRDIVSWWNCWIQVLSALNPVDPLPNCDVWEQWNMFAKCFAWIILQYVPEGCGSWKYNHYIPVAKGEGKRSNFVFCLQDETILILNSCWLNQVLNIIKYCSPRQRRHIPVTGLKAWVWASCLNFSK